MNRAIALSLALVAAFLWARVWFNGELDAANRLGAAGVQAQWDAANGKAAAKNATAAAKAERVAREDETLKQTQAERIAREQANREDAQRTRALRAEQRNRSLLDSIEDLNARNAELSRTTEDAATRALAHEATTARQLLGQCSSRYTAVAGTADQLRDQVTGLQDFVSSVCIAPLKDQ